MQQDRWPPVYDFAELAGQIQSLAESSALEREFFQRNGASSLGDFCQGDIVSFQTAFPFVDEQGEPAAEGDVNFWLLLSNTCDMNRELKEVTWAQLVPLESPGRTSEVDRGILSSLRRYVYSRRFYVPSWTTSFDPEVWIADFLRPVTFHRDGLKNAEVVARLSLTGWALLHSCLVRFLARDDGRYDSD